MRILLDENLPHQLRHYFPGDGVATVTWMGWDGIKNGKLLDLAEEVFDLFITMDKGLPYQQDIGKRKIGVIVLVAEDNQEETIIRMVPKITAASKTVGPGEFILISGT